MSDNPLALLQQNGGALAAPAVLHSLMADMQSSEMQSNVGISYAIVSIKGKSFKIKHGGADTQLTVNMNGQLYAAQHFDVVIPRARAELSKTYYRDGYTEGASEQPDCWAEDGITPLAPLEQRPIVPATGQHCTDCRMCPMNAFGSKTNADTGSRGKACADTRKIIVVPVNPTGQAGPNGQDIGRPDFDNVKFGGPMLLRVPAASLRTLADYDQKLQGMGLPYFGVITRIQFDQALSYPKLLLSAVRILTEGEAQEMLKCRDSAFVKQVLDTGQTAAPSAPAAAQLPPPATGASVDALLNGGAAAPAPMGAPIQPAPAPVAPAPVQQVQPAPTPAPNNVVPIQQAVAPAPAPAPPAPAPAPAPPAPAPAPPAPANDTPAGYAMTALATTTYGAYKAGQWTDQQLIDGRLMEPVAAAAPAPVQAAPIQPAALVPPTGAAPVQAAPEPTQQMFANVDALLGS
jgi:hypothetical protein